MDEIINLFKPHEDKHPSINPNFPNYRPNIRVFWSPVLTLPGKWSGYVEFYSHRHQRQQQIISRNQSTFESMVADLKEKSEYWLSELDA